MALPENPITRKETYLAKIAGQEVQIPDVPITREEAYLDQIAKEGTGTKVIANPDDVAEDVLHKVEIDGEIYSVPSGGGGGGSNDYLDLDNLPQVNGVELKGNKSTSDLGIKFEDLPDAPTIPNDLSDLQDDSTHRLVTDTEKATWNGKSDFSGSFSDLSNKPENANTFQGTIAEWNQLTTAEKKAYDHASIPDSLDGNVTFPASKVMMLDGDSVEERIEDKATETLSATNCTLEATVKNGILFIYFEIIPSTANTWVSPFSDALPAGYRPNRSLYVTAISSDLKVASVYIKNDGTIQIKGASTSAFIGCASYYI